MPLFSIFSSKPKNGIQAGEHLKIYSDTSFKSSLKVQDVGSNATAQQILDRFKQQDYDTIKLLILVVVHKKNKQIILQRRVQPQDMPYKLLVGDKSSNTTFYFVYKEIPLIEFKEMYAYRQNNSLKYNALAVCNQEQYSRYGTLYKKSKSGQYKQRYFKLMNDCLVYHKKSKNPSYSYITLENLIVDIPKDKNVFILKSDSLTYVLKAQSRTDFTGWVYSIKKQITLLKEAKLFSDYDIKVRNMQTSKIDYYKNLTSSIGIGLRQLLACFPLFLHELIKEIEKSTNIQDIYIVRLLQLGYDFKVAQPKDGSRNQERTQDKEDYLNKILEIEDGEFFKFVNQKYPKQYKIIEEYKQVDENNFSEVFNMMVPLGVNYLEKNHYEKMKKNGKFEILQH